MLETPDGLYSAHLTAHGGVGFAMLVLQDGILAGADTAGVRFDGPYEIDPGSHVITGSIKVDAPANGMLLQGVQTGPEGLSYHLELALPPNFGERDYVTLATPFGPTNARLRKIRNLP